MNALPDPAVLVEVHSAHALVVAGDFLLFQQRDGRGAHPYARALFGGGFEAEDGRFTAVETPQYEAVAHTAMRRELREELAVEVDHLEYMGRYPLPAAPTSPYDFNHMNGFVFEADRFHNLSAREGLGLVAVRRHLALELPGLLRSAKLLTEDYLKHA